ncbi:YfhO family protein [Clostridium cuniculi]|uniref:YfhO family protein n=1 Tax=Clostridium cuniculi TaxID=2548455 RepID=UPI0010559A29|nr:YfhO family protein [Clostridium cuniculi]
MKNLKLKLKENYVYLLSFIIPIILMGIIYAVIGIYPFGNKNIITSDMYLQYVAFLSRVKDILSGDAGIFYSFSKSLGGNTAGLFAYYMSSPFNLIIALFPKEYIGEVIALITLIKLGFAGLTSTIYLSKTYKKKNITTLMFSLCYCFMAYNINFQINIMWLDAIILLPLVALGIDKLINESKYKLYVITLFITIVSNYYIGYMVCIFSVLYFIYKIILNNKISLKKIGTFIGTSAISGALSAFILVPTILSLSSGKAEFKLFESAPEIMIEPSEVVARLFIGNFSLKQITGSYTNIYCGVIITILVLLYFINKNISKKERISSGMFMIVFLLSTFISTLNLVWHGFDYPVGFAYRFSFLISFLSINLAYKEFISDENLSKIKVIVLLLIGSVTSIWISIGNYEGLTKTKILVTSMFFVAYVTLLKVLSKIINKKNIVKTALALLVSVELVINAYSCLVLQSYAPREYIYNYINDMQPIVNELREEMDNFYRMEEVFTNTYDDSMLLNYYGITHSSSSNDSNTKEFMEKMGFKTAPSFEGYNRGGLISVDSLLGLKYQIAAVRSEKFSSYEYTENNYYKKVLEQGEYIVYENPFALPIAFMVNEDLKDVKTSNVNTFDLNNNILSSMVKSEEIINKPLELKEIESNNLTSTTKEGEIYYEKVNKDEDASIIFTVEASDNNPVYMFLKSELYENKINNYNQVLITINDSKEFPQFDSGNYNVEYIGTYNAGDEIKIKVNLKREQFSLKELQVYSCDISKFEEIYNNLNENTITNTVYKDGYISGDITVTEDKTLLYTSIPYDEGWSVTVDGVEVEYIKILDGLIGVELSEGNHNIEFKYKTPGLLLGSTISLVAIFIIVFVEIAKKKSKYYNNKTNKLSQ